MSTCTSARGFTMTSVFRTLRPGENRLDPGFHRGDGREPPPMDDIHSLFTDAEGRRWERLGNDLYLYDVTC